MSDYRLAHLDDATLLRDLATLVRQDRVTTAALLAHIAEVDARRLYLPAGFSSMFAYCVGALHLSESATAKRLQAARVARRFPRLFTEVAGGRLHLTAVCLLAPHLDEDNLDELVAAATHRRQDDIEAWLAQRSAPAAGPLPAALRARVIPVRLPRPAAPPLSASPQVDPAGPGLLDSHAVPHVNPHTSPEEALRPDPARFIVRVPIGEATHAKLRHAQDLLAHSVPDGDLGAVLDRALDALIAAIEKRKSAATDRPRPATPKRAPARGRTIPAHVRRAVWERDGGRCTFTSAAGRRCDSRRGLEFDHLVPFARGGGATVEGMRLCCRAHNQYAAERAFGEDFMRRKREAG